MSINCVSFSFPPPPSKITGWTFEGMRYWSSWADRLLSPLLTCQRRCLRQRSGELALKKIFLSSLLCLFFVLMRMVFGSLSMYLVYLFRVHVPSGLLYSIVRGAVHSSKFSVLSLDFLWLWHVGVWCMFGPKGRGREREKKRESKCMCKHVIKHQLSQSHSSC